MPQLDTTPDSFMQALPSEATSANGGGSSFLHSSLQPAQAPHPQASLPEQHTHTVRSLPMASSSTLVANQSDVDVSSPPQLPALSNLNDLLDGHDRWRTEATSRILRSVIGASSGNSPRVPPNSPQEDEAGRPRRQSVHPNRASAMLDPSPKKLNTQPPSLSHQLSQIIAMHDTSGSADIDVTSTQMAPSDRDPVGQELRQGVSSYHAPDDTVLSLSSARTATPVAVTSSSLSNALAWSSKDATSTPTSANANRKTLARDILRALRLPASTKRKREKVVAANRNDRNTSLDFSPLAKKNKTAADAGGELEKTEVRRFGNLSITAPVYQPQHAPPYAHPVQPASWWSSSSPQSSQQHEHMQRLVQHMRRPVQHTQQPVQHMQQPVQHTQQPVQHMQQPIKHMQQPLQNMQQPAQHMQQPAQHMQQPVQHIQQPVQHMPIQHMQPPMHHSSSMQQRYAYAPAGQPPIPIRMPSQPSTDIPVTWPPTSKPQPVVPSSAGSPHPSGGQRSVVAGPDSSLNDFETSPAARSLSAAVPGNVDSPSKAMASKPPLFLASSESPPASQTLSSTPPLRISHKRPFVELGPSPSKFKSNANTTKSPIFANDSRTSTPMAPDSMSSTPMAPDSMSSTPIMPDSMFDPSGDVEPSFGRPTGILASASTIELVAARSTTKPRTGLRRSLSQVVVSLPRVDTSAWYSEGKLKTRDTPKKIVPDVAPYHDEEAIGLIQDFARRLVRRRCYWKNCEAVLDSGEKLAKHTKIVHAQGTEKDKRYICRWIECQGQGCYVGPERFTRHLQWHVNARLYCGYQDCEFQTRLPAQLVRHVAEDHDLDDALRPLAMPNKFGPPEVPMSVETLPAYMSVPLQVSGQPITADRHQRLGPWVLHRIFGKVDIRKVAANAGVPPRSLLGRQKRLAPVDDMTNSARHPFRIQDEYEIPKKEGHTRSFRPLESLPLVIDEVEVDENNGEDTAPNVSGPGSPESTSQPAFDSGSVVLETDTTTREVIDLTALSPSADSAKTLPVGREELEVDVEEVEELL